MNSLKTRIIFEGNEQNPFVVLFKPAGLPSAPLKEGEKSALTQTLSLLPELRLVRGKKSVEYGLLHRLDTETSGLLLIARTQTAYESLLKIQMSGLFIKKYAAFCRKNYFSLTGFPALPGNLTEKTRFPLEVKSLFRAYGKKGTSVRPVLPNLNGEKPDFAQKKAAASLYVTSVESLKPYTQDSDLNAETDIFLAECSLKRGFRHQIRCHLFWLGYPIIGDKVYVSSASENLTAAHNFEDRLHLYAHTLEFPHPLSGKTCIFEEKVF